MPSALAAAEVATTPSAARAVWGSPLYRGATVALFLSGLGTSAAAPQITLFLVNDLHVSLTTAGLFYLTNITAPLAGYLIGARSDRTGKRLGLFRWCALAGSLGWVAMALADRVWMPFVISAVVLAFSGAASSQLFAAVHDDLRTTASPVADGVVSIVRMALTAGWVVGPVLGSILATAAGSRVMLTATGACALAQIIPMGFARTGPARRGSARPGAETASATEVQAERLAQRPKFREMLPLFAFTGLYVFVYAGEPIKYGYLPIYMRDDMHLPTVVSGAVIGIQPLIELILMPASPGKCHRKNGIEL
jgi:SET family sugar efflux transporter-like MFS transporter